VKTVRFSTKTGDPSREFSLFGERQAVKHRALFVWLWEVAPVLTAWLSLAFNPLTVTVLFSCGLTVALWFSFPWDGSRYVMSQAANAAALTWSLPLGAMCLLSSLAATWWLRLGGERVSKDDVYSSIRPHAAAVSRWKWQRPLNGVFFGLFALWCIFVCIVGPGLAVQGRRTSTCQIGSCESSPGVVDGTCGVGGCGCGNWNDISCSAASGLTPYCPVADSPLCSEDSSKASGAHGLLLMTAGGTVITTMLLALNWVVNHVAIILAWKRGESDPSPSLKAEAVPYHKVTLTFEPPHRGAVVFTVGADEDVGELTRLLLPEVFASPLAMANWALPAAPDLWTQDEDPSTLLANPTTMASPEDLQWD